MAAIHQQAESIEISSDEQNLFKKAVSGDGESSERKGDRGNILQGRIIKINNDFVMIDTGDKSERRLEVSEITGKNGELLFNEGDEIPIYFSNGKISHTRAKRAIKAKEDLEAIAKKYGENLKDKIIEVKLTSKAKNGFIALWNDDGREVECFLPFRESAIKAETKALGRVIKVCVTKLGDNSVFISRKRYFDTAAKYRSDKVKELLEKGEILRGEVVSITDFGIFVNIDGIEGMVHTSELSHKSFANPSALYKIGDVVEVKILKYDEEKSKLSFSIKALTNDPWEDVVSQLQVGYTIKAVVSSIQPYGAFIDAGNDIEGFLHITEIAWEKNIKDPKQYLSVGQEIDVEIIELDAAKKRLRVSLKKLLDKPFTKFVKAHKEGDILSGEVATLTDFGAFVRFGNVDGLLHNEDLSWDKKDKCKGNLKIGDNIEVKIIKIDKENEKISLSRKMLLESPVDAFAKHHKIGDIVKGEVVEIKDFGVFVKLDKDVDALIRMEDLPPLKKEEIKIKDSIEACIAYIDTQNAKVRLSVRQLTRKKEQDELRQYNNDDEKMTLRDRININR